MATRWLDIYIEEFSPSNVLDLHFSGSENSAPEKSPERLESDSREVIEDHDMEARQVSFFEE